MCACLHTPTLILTLGLSHTPTQTLTLTGVDLKIQAQLRLLGGQMFLHDQSFINAASVHMTIT